jgi:hypothetical protein
VTGDRPLAYAYLRVGDGPIANVPVQHDGLRVSAAALGYVLSTVFIDLSAKPALERPALRSLLDVAHAFRPDRVLTPSAWHLSQWPGERADLLERFRSIGSTVIAVRHGKAATLVVGAGGARHG